MPLTKPRGGSIVDPDAYDLERLAAHERLWLWRHRQRSNRPKAVRGPRYDAPSQAEMAERLGISRGSYAQLEAGGRGRLSAEELASVVGTRAFATLVPTVPELCLIARRRSGLEMIEVRDALGGEGFSRPRLLKKEARGDATLVAFWEGRGFRFPPGKVDENVAVS